MEAVFLHLLNMSITATWIALAVIVLRVLLKKAPKWIMSVLWGFVALRLICPFSIESVFSLIPSTETVPRNIVLSDTPAINSGFSFVNQAVNPIISSALSPNAAESVNPLQIIAFAAAVVWLAGVLAMLGYTIISYLRIRGKVSEAVRSSDGVWRCDRISTPFILGIIRPKIYLPSSMNESDTDYVLSHETAHLKRKDYIWKPLGFLLLTVYWFNPILWVAYALLCRDIELACDEKVIKEKGAEVKKPYSEALINCSVPRRMIAACPLAFGEVGMKERVKSVLSYKKPAFWLVIVAVVACAVTAVCLLTNPVGKYSISGKYTVSESIYCDGVFSYYMTPETAPSIAIDENMKVSEMKDGEVLSSGLFEETELSDDNFGSLFNGSEIWQNGESAESLQKQNKTALYTSWQASENGIFPYMILRQKDGTVYIVYANVEDGKPSCIRWIYALEWQEQTNAEIDSSLAAFLDTTIMSHHRRSGISENPFICIDYKILDTEKSGSETTLYMWVLYREYSFDGELHEDSGSHTPTVITVGKKTEADGLGYELVEYWEPGMGSQFGKDIKSKFPLRLQRKALDSQWCIEEQEANCLKSAQEYYKTSSAPADVSVPETTVTRIAEENTQPPAASEGKKPYFKATVLEVNSSSVLVEPFEGTDERKSSDKISISLNVISAIPVPALKAGDKIRIEYNGTIAETYPAQIDTVFAIYALDENVRCYCFKDSAEPAMKPSIVLSNGNRFQFTYSFFSSYIAIGSYELTDTVLTLKTDDGQNTYVFAVKGDTYVFDAGKSSAIPKYKYSKNGEAESPVPDGAVFR